MTSEAYRHTQPGYLTSVALGAGFALTVYQAVVTEGHPLTLAMAALVAACLVVFSSLTVEIADGALRVWFRTGLIRRRLPLDEIRSARVVSNPWYAGWGIRWIPGGWLWNVSGTAAVELHLATGERFRIGTDAPGDLARELGFRGVTVET